MHIPSKRQVENTQINKIRNKNRNITTHTKRIQRINKSYIKKLYSKKLGKNLKEMENFSMDNTYES